MSRYRTIKPKEETGNVVVRLPLDLHQEFKAYCAKRRCSMQELLFEYIEELLGSN